MRLFILTLLACFLVTAQVNAVLVNNGGFDEDAAYWELTGGTGGGTASWGGTHIASDGNPGGYITLEEDPGDTWAWAVWYQSIPEDLDALGIPAGTTVSMAADIKAIGTSALDHVYLKIEADYGGDYEVQLPPVTTSWEKYSIDYTTYPDDTTLKCVLVAKDAASAAEIGFDNIEFLIPGGTPALKPVPIVGGGLAPSSDVISWTNPEPNSLGGVITADVFILESDIDPSLGDPNLGPIVTDPGVVQVAFDTTAESVDLSDAGFTVNTDKYYYWAVHITDPDIGTVEGFDWNFQTFDSPPDPNAGADQYIFGGIVSNERTFTLSGSYTDDGKSPITEAAFTEGEHDTGAGTTVAFGTPVLTPAVPGTNTSGTVEVDVTVANTDPEILPTGFYRFILTVTDGFFTETDAVDVGLYATCAEAADADPDDDWDTTGDLDGNCKKDLADFALLAIDWLGCNANKITCPE